jgi:hypothetical protein
MKHDKEKRQRAIQHLKENIPGIETMDPFMDRQGLHLAKKALIEICYYAQSITCIPEQSIINMIVEAQGKTRQRMNHARSKYC